MIILYDRIMNKLEALDLVPRDDREAFLPYMLGFMDQFGWSEYNFVTACMKWNLDFVAKD